MEPAKQETKGAREAREHIGHETGEKWKNVSYVVRKVWKQ